MIFDGKKPFKKFSRELQERFWEQSGYNDDDPKDVFYFECYALFLERELALRCFVKDIPGEVKR